MASVNEVYSALKNLANKDERGFITPSVFNTFTSIAQNKIFNDLFNQTVVAKNYSRRNIDAAGDKSYLKRIQEDLAYFSKTSGNISVSTGVASKPDDLARIISIKTSGLSTDVPVDVIYDEAKINYITASNLSAPSTSSPVALIADDINIFPTSGIANIKVTYYKYPEGRDATTPFARTSAAPKYTASNLGGATEVFTAATSVDFELPDHYVPQLVLEIGKMIGVNLRDKDVFAYTSGEEQKQKQ
jgi:hypothetical protein